MYRCFKYRLWTNANQERELNITLETHRRLYNTCLDFRQLAYEQYGASISYCDQSRWFTGQRITNPYFARLNFSSAEATMRRLDKAFAAFFRRCKEGAEKPGYPRFKSCDRFDSFAFRMGSKGYADGAKLTGNRLRLQHVGTIRVKRHRPVEGTIKTVTLKREAAKWYVILECKMPDVLIVKSNKSAIGIDMGLTHFLTTSEGKREPNPRYLKTALPKLRVASRAVARKKRGGKNRRKAVRRLQKIHVRVRNLRREHHHQVACRLILAFSLIAVESLNIRGMLGNRRVSRAISDAGWSGFLRVLRHKAEKAGAQFLAVDPRGTSQECSGCGQIVLKELSVRSHNCLHCGLSLDRDHNAALNILARARMVRTEPAEVNVGHKTKRSPRSRSRKATV